MTIFESLDVPMTGLAGCIAIQSTCYCCLKIKYIEISENINIGIEINSNYFNASFGINFMRIFLLSQRSSTYI